MKLYQTSGTLGDSYITALKLLSVEEPVGLRHFVRGCHDYWRDSITTLLKLAPCVQEIEFVDSMDPELPRIHSHFRGVDPPEIETIWFPRGKIQLEKPSTAPDGRYWVISTNSGKPVGKGRNTKLLSKSFIRSLIKDSKIAKIKIVVIGTESGYEDLAEENCINLVGKTTMLEAMGIVANSEYFFGPEGLMLYVALSHKVRSTGLYTSLQAVNARILGTPWAEWVSLLHQKYKDNWFIL